MAYESLVEKKLSGETIFEGFILTIEKDEVELINGQKANREVARHSGGVAILALDQADQVTLVDQFRYPMNQVVRELPAGKLDDKGKENTLLAAQRELEEETGIVAKDIHYLGYIYASPGFCDEVLHMYLARDLVQQEAKPDEDEFLNVVKLPFDTVVEQVMSGEIVDGKTVATVLKAKVFLNR